MEDFSAWDDENIDPVDNSNPLTLSGEFLLLPFQNSDIVLCKEGSKFFNESKNRYTNVIPVDETRVKISSIRGDYINANFINLGSSEKMIACQAPKENTIEDFWLMVSQHKVSVILMLTKLAEDTTNGLIQKSAMYWPRFKGDTIKFGCIELQTVEIEKITENIHVSKIKINCEPSFVVTHIYYTGWSDFGIPEIQEIKQVLCILEKERGNNRSSPFICHCSAGLGRTGTIASILCYENEEDDVRNIVTKIRKQRHGMVQTSEQFKFIFRYRDFSITEKPLENGL